MVVLLRAEGLVDVARLELLRLEALNSSRRAVASASVGPADLARLLLEFND